MIRLHRHELSKEARDALTNLSADLTGTGDDRKKHARELFLKNRQTTLFKNEIETALKSMNAGSNLCVYCLNDRGNAIDHFKPIYEDPDEVFTWENYFWSCTVCNSLEKNRHYPIADDGTPLLVNPAVKDPYPYLPLQASGLFTELLELPDESDDQSLTRRINNETIDTFTLNGYSDLNKQRRDAWQVIKTFLPKVTAGPSEEREKAKSLLCESPLTLSVLASIHHTFHHHSRPKQILGESLHLAVESCPEISSWIDPKLRSLHEEIHRMNLLSGKRLIQAQPVGNAFKLHFEGDTYIRTTARNAKAAVGKKLIKAYNDKGMVVFHFYGVELKAPPNEWFLAQ